MTSSGKVIRAVDHDIKPGVTSDEGPGDAWPALRRKILAADILLIGTPIWLGQPSSVCKRVLERMDAFLEETDDEGRMISFGRVAAVAVVGNEDGAHHVSAEIFQALNDVGFTVPGRGGHVLGGRAMGRHQLHRPGRDARGRAEGQRRARPQHGPSRPAAVQAAVSGSGD